MFLLNLIKPNPMVLKIGVGLVILLGIILGIYASGFQAGQRSTKAAYLKEQTRISTLLAGTGFKAATDLQKETVSLSVRSGELREKASKFVSSCTLGNDFMGVWNDASTNPRSKPR